MGGIAGQNLGGVIQCTNQGDINPTSETPAKSEDPLNLGEQVAGWTDVGGIAGYSTGLLQSCRNEGAVGYPHIGYNVGGIAGGNLAAWMVASTREKSWAERISVEWPDRWSRI